MPESHPVAPAPGLRARLVAMWHLRCPRCLQGHVFYPGPWYRLRTYYACPRCRVVFGRGESGYFMGALILSYALAAPIILLLGVIVRLATGWAIEWVALVAGVYFLPCVPALFRYSRVIWMHLNRVLDPNLESEQYLPPRRTDLAA